MKNIVLRIAFLLVLTLSACSPKFDWRDVRGKESPFTVLMPGKPSELSNEVQLGEQRVTMHMTAVKIDGVTFAVGAVKMPDATKAHTALVLIKNALLTNMAGLITQETTTASNVNGKQLYTEKFDAIGKSSTITDSAKPNSPTHMMGRLIAQDVWVYEVLVVGPEKAIDLEATDTFLGSFKA